MAVVGQTEFRIAQFGSGKAGLATVGFTLRNPDKSVHQARSAVGVQELGGGDYGAPLAWAAAWSGYIEWDTGEAVPAYAREEVEVVEPPVADNDPRLGHLDADVSSRASGVNYTAARAAALDRLDVAVSSRADGAQYTAARAALIDHLVRDVPDVGALATEANVDVLLARLTALRAAALDRLDANVRSRADGAQYSAARAALLDHLVRDVPDVAALATEANLDTLLARLTAVRAAALDRLDVNVSSRADAAQWTAARAALVDRLDVAVSTRLAGADGRLDDLDAPISSRAAAADPRLAHLDADVSSRVAAADARLGHLDADVSSRADGAQWTAARAALIDRLDAAVSSRLAAAAYVAPAEISGGQVAAAVLDALLADHVVGGSVGLVLANLDAAVSSRATPAHVAAARDQVLADVDAAHADVLAARDQLLAQIATRLAAADYQPETAGQVAAAVWDALVLDHELANTMGQAVGALREAQDPLTKLVPSGYQPGTAGAALGRLLAGPVSVVSPQSRTATLTLTAGDSYMAVDGRQIDMIRASGEAWPGDLTGWGLSWEAFDRQGGQAPVEAPTVSAPVPAGAGQAVRLELASAVTGKLAAGVSWGYRVEAESPDASRRVTLRTGRIVLA